MYLVGLKHNVSGGLRRRHAIRLQSATLRKRFAKNLEFKQRLSWQSTFLEHFANGVIDCSDAYALYSMDYVTVIAVQGDPDTITVEINPPDTSTILPQQSSQFAHRNQHDHRHRRKQRY